MLPAIMIKLAAVLLLLPSLLTAAVTCERNEKPDGVVWERFTIHRANDLRTAQPGWLQVRLGDQEDWLLLPLASLTEVQLLNRKESLLVWERPAPRERIHVREILIPDEVMKVEAVRVLLGKSQP
jgi:hypothetical protein